MAFSGDATLPGSVFLNGALAAGGNEHSVRKSRSHGGLFTSLAQLIRDPARTLGSALDGPMLQESDILSENDVEQRQVLYLRLKTAESYDVWKATAIALDNLEGNDAWKNEDESTEYDAELVASRLEQLDEARLSCDVTKMLFLIRTSLARGLGGMGRLRLYKHSHVGTKRLIERYIESAQKTLATLLEVSAKQGPNCPIESRLLVEQLLLARQSFGRSALLLSGGGTFGMNHIGVVKTLWHNKLLPRIISGSSAGSIVCAVLCTKTDQDIPLVLDDFCYGDLAVFEKEQGEEGLMKKAARFLKYGALFDISNLLNVMRNLLGDITFQESYNRTRRILNITVSSASLYELPRLLNYVTAPNVMIWSAVCASCSVPFIFSAASLLAKDPRTGKEVPWNQTTDASWIDGSVDNDLPMTRLAEMFNVNHFIVSQVNPHVVPFLSREEEIIAAEAQENAAFPANSTWLHSIASLAKGEALHRLHVLSEMGIFPNYLTKARSVLNQRYSGDITIFPSISYTHFPKILSNPTTEYMLQCLLAGERATWPKLSRIQNHLAIELALDETIRQIRARVVFSPSQVDLRLQDLNRSYSSGNERSKQHPQQNSGLRRDTAVPNFASTNPYALTPHHPVHPLVRLPSTIVSRPLTRQTRSHNHKHNSRNNSQTSLHALGTSIPHGHVSSSGSSDSENPSESDISHLVVPSEPPPSTTLLTPSISLFPSVTLPNSPTVTSPTTTNQKHHRNQSCQDLDITMTNGNEIRPENMHYEPLFHALHAPRNPETGVLRPAVQVDDSHDADFQRVGTTPIAVFHAEHFAADAQKESQTAGDTEPPSPRDGVQPGRSAGGSAGMAPSKFFADLEVLPPSGGSDLGMDVLEFS